MHVISRSSLLAVVATAMIAVGAPTAAQAAGPAQPNSVPASAAAIAQARPSYQTWIADVTAVTEQAEQFLDARLPDSAVRPAIVLDIDNTALQTTYRPGVGSPATPQVLALARQAKADGAAIFFVTSRPAILGWQTEANLKAAGYPVTAVYTRPWFNTQPDAQLKTDARKKIESQGYRIVANIGNNTTDLTGGYAERTFKLPDYNGQLI